MKTFGILLLFVLCTATGMRIASQKTERFRSVGALMQQIQTFSDAVCEETSLQRIAERNAGELFVMLGNYLCARSNAQDESEAASFAVQEWELFDAEYTALLTFFTGLSSSSSVRLRERIQTLERALSKAEQEASETAKQAKSVRAIGVLAGVGLCILLL